MDPKTFTTPGALRLELRIPNGSIELDAEDTSETTVAIEGERDPSDFRIELAEEDGGHRLLVEQHRKRLSFGSARDLRVRIRAPFGTAVEANTGSADLAARGELGSLAFRSGSGDVRFERVRGDAVVAVASGDVEGGPVGGGLVANSASGDVRVASVAGDLVARSASGDVEVRAATGPANVSTASGDIELGGLSRGAATLRSVSGDIRASVAPGIAVWLDLSSVSGDATTELEMGEDGGGGETTLELRATSVSGDVRVRSAVA